MLNANNLKYKISECLSDSINSTVFRKIYKLSNVLLVIIHKVIHCAKVFEWCAHHFTKVEFLSRKKYMNEPTSGPYFASLSSASFFDSKSPRYSQMNSFLAIFLSQNKPCPEEIKSSIFNDVCSKRVTSANTPFQIKEGCSNLIVVQFIIMLCAVQEHDINEQSWSLMI